MNSFLLTLKCFLQSSSKQRFWIMFCHHKSVLLGFTQKRRFPPIFPRIFRFLRMQRDKGKHSSAVARAILCRLTTIWLSKTFAIVFANVIAEAAKENILNSSTSLDAIIVLVHASTLCQYLCRPCKRGMKLTTLTRMKLVPVWDFTCKHPLRDLIEDELLHYVITPGPQDTNLLGQKRKGISKVHMSYILHLKKTWKTAKNRIILKYYD